MRLKFKDAGTIDPNAKIAVTAPARCGHHDVKEGPSKFRSAMTANIATRDCKNCRREKILAEQAAAIERRKLPKPIKHPRLPDGARYELVFNANTVIDEERPGAWIGTLTSGQLVVEDTALSVTRLVNTLGKKLRQELVKP